MNEQSVVFGSPRSLVGILTEPELIDPRLPAVLILNAGVLHRVGPNRLHVKLARQLARIGILSMRFDLAGIGDSKARTDGTPIEVSALEDCGAASRHILDAKGVESVLPIGICSGADLALRAAARLDCVTGAVLVNGAFVSEETPPSALRAADRRMRTRYYRQRLFNPTSWLRLLSGKSNIRKAWEVFSTNAVSAILRSPAVHSRGASPDWREALERHAEFRLIYSEGGDSLDTYRQIHEGPLRSHEHSSRILTHVVEGSDHVFTPLWSQEHFVQRICEWIVGDKRDWMSKRMSAAAFERALKPTDPESNQGTASST